MMQNDDDFRSNKKDPFVLYTVASMMWEFLWNRPILYLQESLAQNRKHPIWGSKKEEIRYRL